MRGFCFVVVGALAACSDPISTQALRVELLTSDAWGGGEAVLVSPVFRGNLDLVTVLVGGDTAAPLRRIAEDTIAVPLPEASGEYAVRVSTAGHSSELGAVVVYGFTGRVHDGPELKGYPLLWPIGSPVPTFLANGRDNLVFVDIRYGAVYRHTYPDSIHDTYCLRGAGPTVDPSVVVLHPSSGSQCAGLRALRLHPEPSQVDSSGLTDQRIAAWVGPQRWLVALKHHIAVHSGGVLTAFYTAKETNGFRISPRGDRIVPLTYSAIEGLLVFDTAGPSLAYSVESILHLGGAAFTPEGDTLFLAGVSQAWEPILMALSASDGSVLDSVAPDHEPWDLWLDPTGPWLFSVGVRRRLPGDGTPEERPVVHVIDRRDMRTVGTFGPPEDVTCIYSSCNNLYLIPYLAGRAIYAIQIPGQEDLRRTRVFRFDLLPVGTLGLD